MGQVTFYHQVAGSQIYRPDGTAIQFFGHPNSRGELVLDEEIHASDIAILRGLAKVSPMVSEKIETLNRPDPAVVAATAEVIQNAAASQLIAEDTVGKMIGGGAAVNTAGGLTQAAPTETPNAAVAAAVALLNKQQGN